MNVNQIFHYIQFMQITLLWHRAVNDENKMRIFTLVNAEKLQFKVCEKALNNLELITQGSNGILVNCQFQVS